MTDPDFDPSRFSPVPMMSAVRNQRRYNPIAGLFGPWKANADSTAITLDLSESGVPGAAQ